MSFEPVSVDVMLFARAVEIAGIRMASISVPPGSTIDELRGQLIEQYPTLDQLAAVSRWAVGNEFVDQDYRIQHPIRIAMIPPVSGG